MIGCVNGNQTTGPRLTPMARRAIVLLGGLGVLVAVALLAGKAGPWGWRQEPPPQLPTLTGLNLPTPTYELPTLPPAGPPPAAESNSVPPWVWVLLGVLALLLVAALLWALRGRRRSAVEAEPAEPAGESLAPGPRGEFDQRVAASQIIACWQRVEQTAAAAGHPRLPQQTPTEFLAALLPALRADPDSARTLLRLYHRARFDRVSLEPEDALTAHGVAEYLLRQIYSLPGPAGREAEGWGG